MDSSAFGRSSGRSSAIFVGVLVFLVAIGAAATLFGFVRLAVYVASHLAWVP